MAEQAKKGIMVKSKISKKISGAKLAEYKEAVKKLTEIANELVPDGLLIVNLCDRQESFSPVVKAQKDLMDLDIIYSYVNTQRDPSMVGEFQESLEKVNDFVKIVGKRKKMRRNNFKKKERKEVS